MGWNVLWLGGAWRGRVQKGGGAWRGEEGGAWSGGGPVGWGREGAWSEKNGAWLGGRGQKGGGVRRGLGLMRGPRQSLIRKGEGPGGAWSERGRGIMEAGPGGGVV